MSSTTEMHRERRQEEESHVVASTQPVETGPVEQGGGKGFVGTIKEKLGLSGGAGPEVQRGPSAEEEVKQRVDVAAPATPGAVKEVGELRCACILCHDDVYMFRLIHRRFRDIAGRCRGVEESGGGDRPCRSRGSSGRGTGS